MLGHQEETQIKLVIYTDQSLHCLPEECSCKTDLIMRLYRSEGLLRTLRKHAYSNILEILPLKMKIFR